MLVQESRSALLHWAILNIHEVGLKVRMSAWCIFFELFLALFRARKPANNRFDHYLYFPSWLVVKVQSFCYVNLMMTTGSKNFKRMKLSCSSPKETPKRPTFQFPEPLTRFIFLNCFFSGILWFRENDSGSWFARQQADESTSG